MHSYVDKDILMDFQEEVEEYLPEIRTRLQVLEADPTTAEPLQELHRLFHSIKGAAAMVGFDELSKTAAATEQCIEDVQEGETTMSVESAREWALSADSIEHGLAAALKALDQSPEEDLPQATTPTPNIAESQEESEAAFTQDEALSEELLEVFQEEAEEHLQAVAENLRTLEDNPDQPEAVQEIRRAVHTIKGAAGMVGLMTASRVAHRSEDLLDDLYENNRPVTPEILAVLFATTDVLEDLASGKPSGEDMPGRVGELFQAYDSLVESSSADVERLSEAVTEPAEATAEDPFAEQTAETEAVAEDEAYQVPQGLSDDLLETFREESDEHLAAVNEHLRALQTDAHQRDRVQEIRRSIHTIKGAAGVVGLEAAMRLAHRCEDLLDELYDRDVAPSAAGLELLFATADTLDDIAHGRASGPALEEKIQVLCDGFDGESAALPAELAASEAETAASVEAASAEATSVEAEPAVETPVPPAADLPSFSAPISAVLEEDSPKPERATQYVRVSLDRIEELIKLVSELMVNRSALDQHYTHYTREVGEMGLSVDRLRRLTSKLETEYTVGQLLDQSGSQRSRIPSPAPDALTSSTKEFDELEFDRYTDFHLISRDLTETSVDLGSANTQLRGVAGELHASILRVNRLSSDVQDRLMRLSMSPVSSIENRLHRTVRVTAGKRDKLVDFRLEGSDVELDKGILEDVVAPLEHLLRNAVDHGIESPEERIAAGKPERGIITIRALLEGTQVSIEVRDDGRGLDAEKLRTKAVESGRYSGAEAQRLSHRELYSLLFQPGFTTAKEISDISGRGVGLDIVRSTVLGLNGAIITDSEKGFGVTFTIRLPTTLAVTRVLMVESNGHLFAVPAHSVNQVLRVEPRQFKRSGGKNVLEYEGHTFDVVHLSEALDLDGEPTVSDERIPVLAVEAGDRIFALVVDQMQDAREIVVKTLGGLLRHVEGISGATTMGDGSVVLILNPAELKEPASPRTKHDDADAKRKTTVLVVDDSLSVRRVLTNLLTASGFETMVAKDGVEALELLEAARHRPDAMLFDVEMPRMDGYELVSAVRAQERFAGTPIVMLTSRAGEKHRSKAFQLGATDYLVKPFQQDKLLGTVTRVVAEAKESVAQ